ncbi:hypothetical protein BDY19DRAFT_903005 [Irpex rosettiformis]|uniref:Uncharacterized protein n=1 Tax=Irpex rosettiformis TaxID=378272 RepID=A0ACB8UG19_9APHY|nr:hypothetical protein BDY19DRAFT_903005 [Irpex rosettiformis]
MTRGRRKDLTIPPSRALLQQRDYRARKAQYVADLEERVRKAEDENTKLRREIDSLRVRTTTSGTMGPSPEVVSASSELMHQLTAAASCLARFQQLTFTEQAQAHAIQQAQMQTQNLQPQPPLAATEPTRPTLPSMHEAIHMPLSQGTSYPPSTPSHTSHSQSRQHTPPRAVLHPSRHTQPQSHSQQAHHHHHSLSPNLPPVHARDFQHPTHSHAHHHQQHPHQHVRMSPPETPRQTSVNGGPPSSSSSSAAPSVSASPASTRILPPPTSSSSTVGGSRMRGRSDSFTVYNELENAWGYFDSRDLGPSGGDEEEDDDEDQLFAEEHDVTVPGMGRMHRRSPPGIGRGGLPSPRSMLGGRRTSDMRSTSSSGEEDSPMRMREDSPMRTR